MAQQQNSMAYEMTPDLNKTVITNSIFGSAKTFLLPPCLSASILMLFAAVWRKFSMCVTKHKRGYATSETKSMQCRQGERRKKQEFG